MFAVDDDYSDTIQYYLPILSLQIDLKQPDGLIDIVVCYHMVLHQNYDKCEEYRMKRKYMLSVDNTQLHFVNMLNIIYPLWSPHACKLQKKYGFRSLNISNTGCCIVGDNQIIHNYQVISDFFLPVFGCKWNPIHYHSQDWMLPEPEVDADELHKVGFKCNSEDDNSDIYCSDDIQIKESSRFKIK